MEADGHSRRGNKSDFYITPFPCVRALLDNTTINYGEVILDPCCGTGVIGRVLAEMKYVNVVEYDISTGSDFLKEVRRPGTIIANPPYSLKNEFIEHALSLVRNRVYMILPMSVVSYNEFHSRFLANEHYWGRYLMTPKFFMTDEETENPRRGGISAYAWFMWCRDPRPEEYSFEKYIDLRKYFNADRKEISGGTYCDRLE